MKSSAKALSHFSLAIVKRAHGIVGGDCNGLEIMFLRWDAFTFLARHRAYTFKAFTLSFLDHAPYR